MATLTLTQLWINRMDTGEGLGFYSAERGFGKGVDGEVRKYAGGRRRAVTMVGVNSDFQATLKDVTLANLTTIESWIGLYVQIRDHRGKIWTGSFFDVKTVEVKSPYLYDAAIQLTEVTSAEGV